jgi:aquaporin Z
MSKYLVEFLGTMFLMYVIVATDNWVAIGSALAIALLLGGSVSGGSFNPAVTIALYSGGKIAKEDVLPYIIVEILGALAGFYAYNRFVDKSENK